MRVLFFTKYTRQGASSRLRTFQFIPYFQANGIECTISPFFNDDYLAEVYATKHHNKWQALKSFLKRCLVLLTVKQYDKVVIEKELFPYLPAFAERLLSLFNVHYIVDYDDAIWHNYDVSPNPFVRLLLKNKIDVVMRKAALVVAGNTYIQEKARNVGAKNCVVIPTVVDVDRYLVKSNFSEGVLQVGWIGSPITSKYLHALLPVFAPYLESGAIQLRLIGAHPSFAVKDQIEVLPWSEAAEVDLIRSFDIGIMPLEDSIWERGKCGYKLIQYMACGLPVIGTPLGVNDKLIKNNWNGWKAKSIDEWREALQQCVAQRKELSSWGLNGRRLIEREYSLQFYRDVWLGILKE